jgi:hypothetical protein
VRTSFTNGTSGTSQGLPPCSPARNRRAPAESAPPHPAATAWPGRSWRSRSKRCGMSASRRSRFSTATRTPAPSSGSLPSQAFCQRRIFARSFRRRCSVSILSREAQARTRVESMATVPKRPNPRHLHHLRKHVVQRPPVPPPQRAQRPVIRPLPTRQIAQPRSSRIRCSSPPRTCHPRRIGVEPYLQPQRRSI